ncbi:basic amino acid/polyamine antiporter [Vibrio sp. SS-MA-C1-2]|uniref:basic amino acid/polyamine antiporter n=1 Tax=Vibrio sp. SS-MA-C1-2 TaxID=2908646 RepID=UPI001F21BBFF|nr:basic amino acid/polyamine antiporter [Vibrio sp. SS-MA-C1-2]UJF17676.1 basic amino acid/polyamine antiporter [Vibrio sp. SS-MA-C1-2]
MDNKLGLGSMTALVIGSMIGAGVFSLPQNMAAVASPAAVMIGWSITGIGMIFLALSFQYLTALRPDIDSGVFGYAQAGFGDFVGFCSAWGYWFSAMLSNISYLVIVFSTLGLFFDTPQHIIFGDGNTMYALIGASIFLWGVHALVSKGVQTAALINLVTTFTKLIPMVLFIICGFIAFKWNTFVFDFTGLHFGNGHGLMSQIKSMMIITVWAFIGVEGAVVVSGKARKRSDIGKATILGLLTALVIYILVTLLSMGVISTQELATYKNPSMAEVLKHVLGPWGEIIIGIGLIISVSGAFLSWTVLATEAPYVGAKCGIFPKSYEKQNKAGTATRSLWLTSISIQVCLFIVMYAGSTYNSLLIIASEMILLPYLFVAAFMLKVAIQRKDRGKLLLVGLMATIYGIWLLYASGAYYLLLSALLYLPGLFFYVKAKKEQGKSAFVGKEYIGLIFLIIVAIIAAYMLIQG